MLRDVLSCLLLTTLALAQKVGLKSELGFACWNSAFDYNFDCPLELPYNKRCASLAFLCTVYDCINSYGTCSAKVEAAYQYVHDQCHYWGNVTIPVENMKQDLWANAKYIQLESSLNSSSPLQLPVHVSPNLFNEQITAAHVTKEQYDLGKKFGISLLVYWAVILGCAVIFNVWKLTDREYLNSLFGKRATNVFRSYVTLPALIGKKHLTPHPLLGCWSVAAPTRAQSILIAGSIALNIALLFVRLDINTPKPLVFVHNSHKVARYLANRSGLMAVYLLPVTILFACRNNPFIAFTGWSFHTFKVYHKWCARMMVFNGLLHGVLLTWYSVREKIAIFKWKNIYNWPAGNTCLYCMVLMVIFTAKPVRRRAFELFLAIHQFFFLSALVGICVHMSDYGWLEPPIGSICIYLVEYFFRFYTVIRAGGVQDAQFLTVAGDVFRLRISNKGLRVKGGQFVYLRILDMSSFWQAHPFSVMSETEGKIDLMIKAKQGITGRLYKRLMESPQGRMSCKVLVEGPYGNGRNLSSYKHLVMLAGGVGITALYAHATSESNDPCQRLTFVWTVKSLGHIEAFHDHLDNLIELQCNANIQIYITGSDEDVEDDDGGANEEKGRQLSQYIQYGRPPIEQILNGALDLNSGSAAVCACGPPTFLDSTRDTIARCIRRASEPIDYFEEGFT